MPSTAIVMNMFYTGLGIARSLAQRGVPVIGLTSQHRIYGNFTRHAKTLFCPDSRTQPDALLPYLLKLGQELGQHAVIFPTRDDDLEFLDRFREDLVAYFRLAIPERSVLRACLNKWETYLWAQRSGVATPRCWVLEEEHDLHSILEEVTYPCVLKPVAARHWRQGRNWQIVGARKAIGISSRGELLAEYAAIAQADKRALLQEMVPGADDSLVIAACYLNQESKWVAGFNTQKLLQVPEGFGTGCIVQGVDRPELFDPAARLLEKMHFTGIAEVEFKWDAAHRKYKLIEINPRPWDQHRLGHACGMDLIYLAYCEHAGLAMPLMTKRASGQKWIAEDTFCATALSLLWRRDEKLSALFRLARGERIYAIWSATDPLPLVIYFVTRFIPGLVATGVRAILSEVRRRMTGEPNLQNKHLLYQNPTQEGKSHG
jgi:D-aspartate ligase